MECLAMVGNDSVRVVFDGGYSCGKNQRGCWYKEERRGKVRVVEHKSLEFCYEEIALRTGVPIGEIRDSAETAIKDAKKALELEKKAKKKAKK